VFFWKNDPSQTVAYCTDRAHNLPGPAPYMWLTMFQISFKSLHFWRSYCRTYEDRFCLVEYLQYRLFELIILSFAHTRGVTCVLAVCIRNLPTIWLTRCRCVQLYSTVHLRTCIQLYSLLIGLSEADRFTELVYKGFNAVQPSFIAWLLDVISPLFVSWCFICTHWIQCISNICQC